MAKSGNSEDIEAYAVVSKEIAEFEKLISGHHKLLEAIGKL